MNSGDRPLVALVMGDPGGIGAELAARLIASPRIREAVRLVVIGERRVLQAGARIADLDVAIGETTEDEMGRCDEAKLINLETVDFNEFVVGEATQAGGKFALHNFTRGLELAASSKVDAVCYMPFNKKAMRLAHQGYDDESRFIANLLKLTSPVREFNVLDKIWNARATSHIPLKDVSASLSPDLIVAAIRITADNLMRSGVAKPRIMVAGLNPHAGDGGSFGSEEIDVIAPAIEAAASQGYDVSGPFPADTVFLSALKTGCHAVLTMYHDQGQIAMKMMGFDSGVTMLGGLDFPVCTPAHGTAYDIAGKGIADARASEEAILLAARLARGPRHNARSSSAPVA